MTIVEHHSAEELQGLFRQEKDARMAKRIWVAWQARLGSTEPQITAAIGRARRTVQIGVPRYNEEGIAGPSRARPRTDPVRVRATACGRTVGRGAAGGRCRFAARRRLAEVH